MSGLMIVPSVHISNGHNPHRQLLLTDGSKEAQPEQNHSIEQAPTQARTGTAAATINPGIWIGSYAHIQAQLLSTDMNRSFRRPNVKDPRDAARAYAQARRRPQAVANEPQLRNVI